MFETGASECFGYDIICPNCGASHDYESWIDDEVANCYHCGHEFATHENVRPRN